MDKNIKCRQLLRRASNILEDATNKLSELIILNKKIKQDIIEKDYHEQILSINAIVPTENLVSYLHYQKAIIEYQKRYDEKLKEISLLVSMVFLYSLQVMNLSIDDLNEIEISTKELSKDTFYKGLNFIREYKLEKIIDLSPLTAVIVELEFKITGDDVNQKNIRGRINRLKSIIIEKNLVK